MSFLQLDKNEVVCRAHSLFLEEFPLNEIDNDSVRIICNRYRKKEQTLEECKLLFQNHFEYFYNWSYNNWMTDVFYFQR